METYQHDGLAIMVDREGARRYQKVSYPIRYGRFSQIETSDTIFQLNLNGEIKHIQSKRQSWQNPGEWLKRNVADDWIHYSAAGYSGTVDLIGEYYLPSSSHPKNAILSTHLYDHRAADHALHSYRELPEQLKRLSSNDLPRDIEAFLKRVTAIDPAALQRRGRRFHATIKGRITVLPPDSRHVDYDVIPVIVADGCLYNCSFCIIKTGQSFSIRSRRDILQQITDLRAFYGDDIRNYNSVFLGMHDVLHAGRDPIEFSSEQAYKILEIEHSHMRNPRLFLFGSVDSLLDAGESLFEVINAMPFETYLNIGMESADQNTLDRLNKPVSAGKVKRAFERMLDVNVRYEKIEITANFVIGSRLPSTHFASIAELTAGKLDRFCSKGALYLSPLSNDGATRDVRRRFMELKTCTRLPTYVYLIQEL